MFLCCTCRVRVDTGLKFGLSRKLRCFVRCELSHGCNSSCELGHTRKDEWNFSVVHELGHARGNELGRSIVFELSYRCNSSCGLELSLVSAEALSNVETHRAALGGFG